MVFEPLALEVLHGVAIFLEFLTDWVAEDRQPAVRLPVIAEAEAETATRRSVVGAVRISTGTHRLEGCFAVASSRHFVAKQTEQHIVVARKGTRMPFKACAFEPLGHE